MQARPKQKISILFAGYIHRDPATIVMLSELMKAYHAQGIKVVFCEEDNSDMTLTEKLHGNQVGVRNSEILLRNPSVQKYLNKSPNLHYTYFNVADTENLMQAVAKVMPGIPYIHLDSHVTCLLRKNTYTESVEMTKIMLELNIPYFGVELDKATNEKMRHEISHHGDAAYLLQEATRINAMTANILKMPIAALQGNDGVIIMKGGANHTHRLAANVLKAIEANKELQQNIDFQIVPVTLFSPYVVDGIWGHEEAIKLTRQNDPVDILPYYTRLPISRIIFEETKGQFHSADFEKLNEKIMTHVSGKSKFVIQAWDESKAKLISDHGGEVVLVQGAKAIVKINSQVLKKPLRDLLGLDRSLITLKGDVEDKLKALKAIPGITIERKFTLNQYIVTFAKEQLVLVQNIVTGTKVDETNSMLAVKKPDLKIEFEKSVKKHM